MFKGRVVDPTREKDTAVERCDVSVEDGEGKVKSRFIIKIMCRHGMVMKLPISVILNVHLGVLKTYRLYFESVAPMHAQFVKEIAKNHWSISSKTLREFVEHFGPGTEQLDIYSHDGRVSLTSFTEKVMSGNGKIYTMLHVPRIDLRTEILRQPLHTTIAIDTLEFGEFAVEEKLHIIISVKDFKSIVTHAGITNTIVKALYSHPASPMQITYNDEGLMSEFILMTIGEARGSSETPAINASRANSKRPASRQPVEAMPSSKRVANSEMPPPPMSAAPSMNREPSRTKMPRPSPPPPQPSLASEDLFLPGADDDRRWDPVDYEEEADEMLKWDAPELGVCKSATSTYALAHISRTLTLLPDSACKAPDLKAGALMGMLVWQQTPAMALIWIQPR